MAYEAGDIVSVPFPFTDRPIQKRRPALVLSIRSFNEDHKHIILAMITSANNPSWPSDVQITNQVSAGLPSPSVIRQKLFTLDERLVVGRLGKLSQTDRKTVKKSIAANLGL